MSTRRVPFIHVKGNSFPPTPSPGNFTYFLQGDDPQLKVIDSSGKVSNSTAEAAASSSSDGSTKLDNYCIMSNYDWNLDDLTFQSKFIIWDSTENEIALEWTPDTALVGDYFRRIAILLVRDTGSGVDIFFTSENASSVARMTKMHNVVFDFENQIITYDKIETAPARGSYNYQHLDSSHIYLHYAAPAEIQIFNITGELTSRGVDLVNNPSPFSSDRVWINGDEDHLYITRYGPSGAGFKSQFVMARKQNILDETILFNLNDETLGLSGPFEIDFNKREVFISYQDSTASFGYANTSLRIVKHDLDTGEKLGRLIVNHMNDPSTGNPYKTRMANMFMYKRKLYAITDRNPILYVIDPYDMSVLHSEFLSGATTGLITDAEFRYFGGAEETGYSRFLPNKIANHEILLGVQSDEYRLVKINPDTYEIVATEVLSDPLNYFRYASVDPVYPPRMKVVENNYNFTTGGTLYTSSQTDGQWRVTQTDTTTGEVTSYANIYNNSGQTTQPFDNTTIQNLTYTDYV